ncbi:MAG: glycosyltransferase [Planctomycetia bacterium]|nr:glycosyltransferase [Planctomycetia bacterium]
MNATAGRDPLVSVILPTYNRECFLGESIRSVIGQTYGNLELIVVDDGSTDGSADLVASIAPEARYVWQANRGPADARNRGLLEARGDLIAFLDSDDAWHAEKLARQVAFLAAHPSVGVVYSARRVSDEHGRVIGGQTKRMHSGRVTEALLQSVFITMPSVVVRRSVVDRVGSFDASLRVTEDFEYWLRASLVAEFAAMGLPLVDVRRWPNRLTSAKTEGAVTRYATTLRFCRDHADSGAFRREIAERALAACAFRAGRALSRERLYGPAATMFAASARHRFTLRAAWHGWLARRRALGAPEYKVIHWRATREAANGVAAPPVATLGEPPDRATSPRSWWGSAADRMESLRPTAMRREVDSPSPAELRRPRPSVRE